MKLNNFSVKNTDKTNLRQVKLANGGICVGRDISKMTKKYRKPKIFSF